MSVPAVIYGPLVSFGSYTFPAGQSYIKSWPKSYTRPTATLAGRARPIDLLAGGPAALKDATVTWTVAFYGPDNTADSAMAGDVEGAVQTMLAGLTAAPTATLTFYNTASGANVSCLAAYTDSPLDDTNRTYSSIFVDVSFYLYADPI